MVDKENKEVLWARQEEKDIVIQESEATRFVSYQECHNALGHPSVQVLNQAMNNLYLNAQLIPKPPKNFHCPACSEAATAVYIKDRLPHSALPKRCEHHQTQWKTPYEALKGEKPSISTFRSEMLRAYPRRGPAFGKQTPTASN